MPRHRLKKFIFLFTLIATVAVGFALGGGEVLAQGAGNVFGTDQVQEGVALGGQDIRTTIVNIINVFLGLLGIIAVGLVIYGGFVYMTSGGDESKISQAKGILTNAVIGLVIILSAFAIVQFFIRSFSDAAVVRVDQDGQNGGGFIGGCQNILDCQGNLPNGGGRCGDQGFVVMSITPNSEVGTNMSNVVVRAVMSKKISAPRKLSQAIDVVDDNGNLVNVKSAQLIADGYGIEMVLDTETPACVLNNAANAENCLPLGKYTAQVTSTLRSVGGQELQTQLDCGNFPRAVSFNINNDQIDSEQPQFIHQADPFTIIPPDGVQVGRGAQNGFVLERGQLYTISIDVDDFGPNGRGGVSYLEYELRQTNPRKGGVFALYDGPKTERNSNETFTFEVPLNLAGNIAPWSVHTITIRAHDVDHQVREVETTITVVGEGCLGENAGEPQCQAPPQCEVDQQCPSQKCIDNQCVPWPMVTGVDRWSGGAKDWVTISGSNFGAEPGLIEFGIDRNENGNFEAGEWVAAQPNLAQCGDQDVWNDGWIIAEVPGDNLLPIGANAPVRVTKQPVEGQVLPFTDHTADEHGPKPGPNDGLFEKTLEVSPGICRVETIAENGQEGGATEGLPGRAVRVIGKGLGNGQGGSLLFGGVPANPIVQWLDREIRSSVPQNLRAGRVSVNVKVGDTLSNGAPFVVLGEDEVVGPKIGSISPESTTRKSFITITGESLGNDVGIIWIAPTQQEVLTCPDPVGASPNCERLIVSLPNECGQTWGRNQIIAQVPDINVGDYFVLLQTANQRRTDGAARFSVVAGAAKPGICAINPVAGPAPLPEGQSLTIVGVNFGNNPTTRFWRLGADANNTATWFELARRRVQGALGLVVEDGRLITTDLPFENNQSMPPGPGPISVHVGANDSNFVNYTVSDCRDGGDAPREGFHCCTEGPEQGIWKAEAAVCEGEVREAGYAWRFSTGRIPSSPQVIEQCNPEDLGELPSPTPFNRWRDGERACVNGAVSVSFSQAMDTDTFDDNIEIYTCDQIAEGEENAGRIDCSNAINVTDDYVVANRGAQTAVLEFDGIEAHRANTWHRVVLKTGLEGVAEIEGLDTPETVPILTTRPLAGEDDVAYYFDFKTSDGTCRLTSISINPAEHMASQLGVVYNLAYGLQAQRKIYFNLFGRGNQECRVVDPGKGWVWDAEHPQDDANGNVADVDVEAPLDRPNIDTQVFATANADGGAVPVEISATSNTLNLSATADLYIDLGDPEVVAFWPNCGFACPNGTIGVRFNRDMWMDDLRLPNVLTLERCQNETCLDGLVEVELEDIDPVDSKTYELSLEGQGTLLEVDTWYKVTVSDQIRSVGRVNPLNGEQLEPGNRLLPLQSNGSYSWKFRTKAEDEICILDRSVIEPVVYTANGIGDQSAFRVIPISSPDECSATGQRLNPWGYGWEWSTTDVEGNPTEELVEITHLRTGIERQPFCALSCVPSGSNIALNSQVNTGLCGNGIVDAGEDCDVAIRGEQIGISCSTSCLRPGNDLAAGEEQLGTCGNGRVDFELGEQCDPAPDDNYDPLLCSERCLWVGSSQEKSEDPSQPWCGSGEVTAGEACDLAISPEIAIANGLPDSHSSIGCNKKCLHEGTRMSRAYCDANNDAPLGNSTVGEHPDCRDSLSICGNNIIEPGEECEFVVNLDGTINNGLLRIPGAPEVMPTRDAAAICTNRCQVQNVCEVFEGVRNSLDAAGLRCIRGSEGCQSDCTLAGSSVLYDIPSVCGDGDVGVGEYDQCEIPGGVAAVEDETIGENPIQFATAVGGGNVNPETKRKEGKIQSVPLSVRDLDDEGNIVLRDFAAADAEDAKGVSDYYLQCGYTEFLGNNLDVLTNRDRSFERETFSVEGENNGWVRFASDSATVVAKQSNEVSLGSRALTMAPAEGDVASVLQEAVPAVPGEYELRLNHASDGEGADIQVDLSYDLGNDRQNIQRIIENDDGIVLGARAEGSLRWRQARESFIIPEGAENVQLRFSVENRVFIDEVSLVRVSRQVAIQTNNCPNNDGNTQGVGSDTCCYPRASRTEEYPVDGAGMAGDAGVCRNTLISVTFDGHLEESAFDENILLVRGDEREDYRCEQGGERDLTDLVNSLIAESGEDAPEGFFAKIWFGIKKFFAGVFGQVASALNVVPQNVNVWCQGSIGFEKHVRHVYGEGADAEKVVETNISLFVSNALQAESTYAVVLRGGLTGITDVNGVGIMAPEEDGLNIISPLDDIIAFRTGRDICRLESVSVEPDSQLYVAPNESHGFAIEATANSGGRIVPTPIYDWSWDWVPADNNLYTFNPAHVAVEGRPGVFEKLNQPVVDISSTNLEGRLAVAGQAVVTADVISSGVSDEGKIFSGFTNLTSHFCENPWPARNVFPYEEGISLGGEVNNDAYDKALVMLGGDLSNGFNGASISAVDSQFFNFSFSYCADAGASADKSDDLPYLQPVVAHDGLCEFSRTSCQENADCGNVIRLAADRVANLGRAESACFSNVNAGAEGEIDANQTIISTVGPSATRINGQDVNIVNLVGCSDDSQCNSIETYTNARGLVSARITTNNQNLDLGAHPNLDAIVANAECLPVVAGNGLERERCLGVDGPTTIDNAVKQFLMFSDKSDDAIGIKVYTNEHRLSARQWFDKQPFGGREVQAIVVDGYDAITDGNNVFINALNVEENGQIRNYIYAFSLSEDSQQNTRDVFEQIMSSLRFNINVSDFGYCQAEGVADNRGNLSRDIDSQDDITNIACDTDFDCRNDNGEPLVIVNEEGEVIESTNGICSNALTKIKRDWDRLEKTQQAQDNLENYRRSSGTYPRLESGTFIPNYTNSRWPSWGLLGRAVNGIATDPINEWSSCDTEDSQTCWDAEENNQRFICPAFSSVSEYEYREGDNTYTLHTPLEYFVESDSAVREFVNLNDQKFDSTPYCDPGLQISPFADRCGDGIINPNTEVCEPGQGARVFNADQAVPTIVDQNGQLVRVNRQFPACGDNQVRVLTCANDCRGYSEGACTNVASCGDGVVGPGEACDDGARNGQYGQCNDECSGRFGAFCGNNQVDFVNSNGNVNALGLPQYDPGEETLEYCDEVDGVCQYIVDDLAKIEPILYFLIDRSGSMSFSLDGEQTENVPVAEQRWTVVKQGLPIVAEAIEGKAKIGISVFSDAANLQSPREVLEVGFHTREEVVAALNEAGNPNGGTPLRASIESLRDRNVFESDERVDSLRPKSFILVVDGDSSDGSPVDVINQLREEDEIYTYVFGIGNTPAAEGNFGIWAETGGTNNFFRVNQPNEFANRIQNLTRCSEYALRPGNSCAYDCQSSGGYCGDGILHLQNGEVCDDGNLDNNDGCNDVCEIENLSCRAQNLYFTLDEERDRTDFYIRRGNYNNLANFNGASIDQCYDGTTGDQICAAHGLTCESVRYWNSEVININNGLNNIGIGWHEVSIPNQGLLGDAGGVVNGINGFELEIEVNDHRTTCDLNLKDKEREQHQKAMIVRCVGQFDGEAVNANIAEGPGVCGNNILEDGERCDLGDQNGRACTPGYGDSCNYCSVDCQEVISVEPENFCGNNRIDINNESCDLVGGEVLGTIAVPQQAGYSVNQIGAASRIGEGRLGFRECPIGYVGELSCSNQCQLQALESTCIQCGKLDGRPGAWPTISFLNPTGPPKQNPEQGDWQTVVNGAFTTIREDLPAGYEIMSAFAMSNLGDYRQPNILFNVDGQQDDRLVAHPLCTSEYEIRFNVPNIVIADGNADNLDEKVGKFNYEVDGESRTVNNDFILSPAVPEGAFRVVVKWTKDEDGQNLRFPGYVARINNARDANNRNNRLDDVKSIFTTFEPDSRYGISNDIGFSNHRGGEYWLPNGHWNTNGGQGIATHPFVETEDTFIQSFTIFGEWNGNDLPYAFFVGAVGQIPGQPVGGGIRIGQFKQKKVTVEVYKHHPGQNNRYSLYPPDHTFELQLANGGNADADYWHVFNIAPRNQGNYEVELVRRYVPNDEGVNVPGPGLPHGTIATDWNEILLNMQASMRGTPAYPGLFAVINRPEVVIVDLGIDEEGAGVGEFAEAFNNFIGQGRAWEGVGVRNWADLFNVNANDLRQDLDNLNLP